MAGINRADAYNRARAESAAKSFSSWRGTPCVFISHQREDTAACRPIADYIMKAGLDIYFDDYDKTLSQLVAQGDPDKITKRIQEGIDYSTHMLCVVSDEYGSLLLGAVRSWLRIREDTARILTFKGITDEMLPDYMKTTEVIRGTTSLNQLIARLLRDNKESLEFRGAIKSASMSQHPLDSVLDWGK